MKRKAIIAVCITACLTAVFISACKKSAIDVNEPTIIAFTIPPGWPNATFNFDSNRLTQEGVELGRKLFYDNRLSRDPQVSCASCHQQIAAFTTFDHDLSHGVDYKHTLRNAPGLANLAWSKSFSWDGSMASLDKQIVAHITSSTDMGETLTNVTSKLKADATYTNMFEAAFGDDNITTQRLTMALTQFMVTMVNNNSKYDKVKRGEATFTLAESLGYDIFKNKCATCHAEPLFTDNSFRNVGLPLDANLKDYGRMTVTRNALDSLKFRVPSLRNVELTGPYGHDGRLNNLDLVMEHYRSKVVNGPNTDPLVKNKIPLSNFEIGQIKAFLYTLTDPGYVNDQRFSAPR